MGTGLSKPFAPARATHQTGRAGRTNQEDPQPIAFVSIRLAEVGFPVARPQPYPCSWEGERRPLACRARRPAEHFRLPLECSPFGESRPCGGTSSPSRRRRHASRVRSPIACIVTAEEPAHPVSQLARIAFARLCEDPCPRACAQFYCLAKWLLLSLRP
jgi:hypothetical protein